MKCGAWDPRDVSTLIRWLAKTNVMSLTQTWKPSSQWRSIEGREFLLWMVIRLSWIVFFKIWFIYNLRSFQVIKPYNSHEARGNAILQVCHTHTIILLDLFFLATNARSIRPTTVNSLHLLLLKQEIKKTKAALLDDTYFCHCHLNIKKALLITNKWV